MLPRNVGGVEIDLRVADCATDGAFDIVVTNPPF